MFFCCVEYVAEFCARGYEASDPNGTEPPLSQNEWNPGRIPGPTLRFQRGNKSKPLTSSDNHPHEGRNDGRKEKKSTIRL